MGDKGNGGPSVNMFCVKSSLPPDHLTTGLINLLQEGEEYSLTDVTLGCEGQFIKAHRIILALASPFFKDFFRINQVNGKANNPLIVVANVKFEDLRNLVKFMYHGKVMIDSAIVGRFLEAAKLLQIQGLVTESVDGSEKRFDSNTGRRFSSSSKSKVVRLRVRLPGATPGVDARRKKIVANKRKRPRPPVSNLSTLPDPEIKTGQIAAAPPSTYEVEPKQLVQNEGDPLRQRGLSTVDEIHNEEEMIHMNDVKAEHIEVYSDPDGPMFGSEYFNYGTSSDFGQDDDSHSQLFADSTAVLQSLQGPSSDFFSPTKETTRPEDSDSNLYGVQDASFVRNQMMIRCKSCYALMGQHEFSAHTHICFRTHSTGHVKPAMCPLCGKTFKNANSLKVHKSTQHRKPREGLSVAVSSGIRLQHLAELLPGGMSVESFTEKK